MIDYLDNLLSHLFLTNINDLATEAQVRFRPPDDDWRAEVQNLQQIALNIYLIDVRESHKLRANACARYQDRLGSSGTVSIANLEQ